MAAVQEVAPGTALGLLVGAVGLSRATAYRRRGRRTGGPAFIPDAPRPRPRPARALSEAERAEVLGALHSERFCDRAPAEVYATLLDEGTYLASERTMYRILAARGEVLERRNQLRRPAYARPELLATRPNELWSWDVTKLLGPAKWTYYYLFVILDVFSRYIVGWTLAFRETARIAEHLIAETIDKQHIPGGTLTVHADWGSSMTSKPVAFLLADLGVTKTHSRPHGLQRQPVLGGSVQDPQVPAGVPGQVPLDGGGPGRSAGTSSPGTTHRTATPGSVS
jgi:putative transposase